MQILGTQTFDDTFGRKSQRKRPKLSVDNYEELLAKARCTGDALPPPLRTPGLAAQRGVDRSPRPGSGRPSQEREDHSCGLLTSPIACPHVPPLGPRAFSSYWSHAQS